MTNNLNEIIKANTEQMRVFTDTVKYVIQECKTVDKKSIKHASGVFDSFKMLIDVIDEIQSLISIQTLRIQSDQVLKDINNLTNLIKNLSDIKIPNPILLKIKLFYLKISIRLLYETIDSLMNNLINIQNSTKNIDAKSINDKLILVFGGIKNIIDVIETINFGFILSLKIKLIYLKYFIKSLFNILISTSDNIGIDKISTNSQIVSILQTVIKQVNDIFTLIKEFLSFKTMFWLWIHGKIMIKRFKKVINYINQIVDVISELKSSTTIKRRIADSQKILTSLNSIIVFLKSIKVTLLFGLKIKIIIFMLHKLQLFIFELNKFVENIDKGLMKMNIKKSLKTIKNIKLLFKSIIDIVKYIIFTSITFILLVPAGIIFLTGLAILTLIINVVIKMIQLITFIKPKMFIKLTLFISLITMLMGIGIAFVAFGLLIPTILKSIVVFGAFILGLMGITLLLAVFGGVISLLAPIIPFILLGLVLISTMIISLGLVMLLLKTLEIIDLDIEKIKENVRNVLDTARMIIDSLFDSGKKQHDNKESKPWYKSVLNWMGNTIGSVLEAILAVSFLALTFISIIFILLIASTLRLLQVLNLDTEKIKENVRNVLDIAKQVISTIFDSSGDAEDKPSNKGFILDILAFFCKPLADILTAIMSIGFLALTFVSIALILAIATELKLIEKIQLDTESIKTKVSNIMDAVRNIINAVIQPDDSQAQPAKGFFRKLLEFALPSSLLGMIDAMMSIGFLALAMVSIELIHKISERLISINNLPEMTGITDKVKDVINNTKLVINEVINNTDISKSDAKNISKFVKRLNVVVDTLNSFKNISDIVDSIKIIEGQKIQQLQQSTVSIINLLDNISTESVSNKNINKRLEQFRNLQEIISDFDKINGEQLKDSANLIETYSKFINNTNTIDLEKIKTTTNLFNKMSEFSQSINDNFEKFAETLDEKITPLLEDLKNTMSEVQIKIEKTGSDISSSVYASSQGNLSNIEMARQTEREMPNISQSEREQITEKRMAEQAQRQANDLASKIDELIEIFRNGEAYVRTT